MPPKAKPAAPSKKTDAKKKEKVIEDKTFGLKNKKGAKQQKFIQQVEKQVKSGGVPTRKLDDPTKTKEKDAKMKEQKEMNLLFRPVQKVEKGADPKTVLCAFFKQGLCTKGAKCKFSHDVAVERKAEKRSVYVDMRDDEDNILDEEKLKELAERREGDKNRPTTDIVCKFFLDAVENNRYGWFWSCPNGSNCIYRHALPQGFMLKKDKKKEDKKDEISLEELIEKERSSLASLSFTKITLESFLAWKKRKLKEKKDTAQKEEDKKRSDYKAGRHIGLSGREMFSFNPELASGDQMEDGDEALNSYQENDDEDQTDNYEYREIELDLLEAQAQEVDDTGTQAPMPERRFDNAPPTFIPVAESEENKDNKQEEPDGEAEEAMGVAINENLFLEDDLDDLEQELEELELQDDSDNS